MAIVEIPARQGKATRLRKGQKIKVINTRGQQVIDDTSGGIHDTLIAACDRYRYELLGYPGYHANCTDNLAAGLDAIGLRPPETPSPLNLFMNIPVRDDNAIDFLPPVSTPGSYVTLRAEMDCVVAF